MSRLTRAGGASLPLGGLLAALAACVPPPAAEVTPEVALATCQAGALAELRRRDPAVQVVALGPLGETRVERRPAPPAGREGGALVLAGRGSSTNASTDAGVPGPDLRYTCLVGTSGDLLFVDVRTVGGGPDAVLAECQGRPAGPAACLRGLAAEAEADLARAEAAAIAAARSRPGAGTRAEVDEPAAESIGAWRVYRDAECARRHDRAVDVVDGRATACLVGLTRARVRELGGG